MRHNGWKLCCQVLISVEARHVMDGPVQRWQRSLKTPAKYLNSETFALVAFNSTQLIINFQLVPI